MTVLSKEVQQNHLLYRAYLLLFRFKSKIIRLWKRYTNKSFRRLLRLLYRILKKLLSLSKWLLAPNLIFKIAIRHGIMLFLLLTMPILSVALFKPLNHRLKKKYLILTKGEKYYQKHTELNNYIQNECKSFKHWKSASSALDEMEGKYEWIMTEKSKYYNYKKLYYDTTQLKQYVSQCRHYDKLQQMSSYPSSSSLTSISSMTTDSSQSQSHVHLSHNPISELMQFIRCIIVRHYCGITNRKLHAVARTCTKQLIAQFLQELCNAIRYISLENTTLSNREKLIYLNELQHIQGRTVLCLSGGASFGPYHTGVALELWRQKLLPQIISGSSTGAMVASYFCTNLESNFPKLADGDQIILKRGCLDHENDGDIIEMLDVINRYFNKGNVLNGNKFTDVLQTELGDITFKEAYKKTGKILNITVTGHDKNTVSRCLNFMTAPNVVIWSAVVASCAFPGLIEPQTLFLKKFMDSKSDEYELFPAVNLYENDMFLDGSMTQDIPIERLQQLFNANNFIVSQVNPLSVMTGQNSDYNAYCDEIPTRYLLTEYLKDEYKLFFGFIGDIVHKIRRKPGLHYDYQQRFSAGERGGLVIYPNIKYSELLTEMLHNPTLNRYNSCVKNGAKATWEHMARLNTLCKVESCLEFCIKSVKYNIINDKVIKDLETEKNQKIGNINDNKPMTKTDSAIRLSSKTPKTNRNSVINENFGMEHSDAEIITLSTRNKINTKFDFNIPTMF